jgi:hypothetical protein
MKTSGRIFKQALEYMTQCVLLPGVELNLDDVVTFYKNNLDFVGVKIKALSMKRSSVPQEY